MMPANFKYILLVLGILLSSSCSTMKITMDYDNNISFAGLKSYAWLPGKPKISGDPKLETDDLMQERIRLGLESWLKTNGYVKQTLTKADFLITFHIVIEDKTKISVFDNYYAYPHDWGYYHAAPRNRTYIYEYKQGAMIIDIANPKTKKLMWRGIAEDELQNPPSPEQKQARIAEVIRGIMANFPPKL